MHLQVCNLSAAYDNRTVLHDINLTLCSGDIVTVSGRAGCGRSTLLKAIMGQVKVLSGSIQLGTPTGACDISRLSIDQRARMGVVWLPETKELFNGLTVEQNLVLTLRVSHLEPNTLYEKLLDDIYTSYPVLRACAQVDAGVLSGGEQQLLAFARSMIVAQKAQLLLLDEPAEGLALAWVEKVTQHIKALQDEGKMILMVEQKMQISDALNAKVVYLEQGQQVGR